MTEEDAIDVGDENFNQQVIVQQNNHNNNNNYDNVQTRIELINRWFRQ